MCRTDGFTAGHWRGDLRHGLRSYCRRARAVDSSCRHPKLFLRPLIPSWIVCSSSASWPDSLGFVLGGCIRGSGICVAPFARSSVTCECPSLCLVAKQLSGLLRHAFRSIIKSCQWSSALLGGGATLTADAELPPIPSQATRDSVHYAHVRLQVAEDVAVNSRACSPRCVWLSACLGSRPGDC